MVLISVEHAYELERWLGPALYQRLRENALPGVRVPTWVLLLEVARKDVFREAVECLAERFKLMRAETAVTRAQFAVLDLVAEAIDNPGTGAYIEGLIRLGGGRAVFSLIDEPCRLSHDLIKRAHDGRHREFSPA